VSSTDKELYFRDGDNNSAIRLTNNGALASGGGGGSLNSLSDAITGIASVYLGSGSGLSASITWDNYSTAVGINSLRNETSGLNTAFGYNGLTANTSGYDNVAIGHYSLQKNLIGHGNTASGAQSLYSNTNGYRNSVFGFGAAWANTTGLFNTVMGAHAFTGNTTGNYNTAIGTESLKSPQAGDRNTALGYKAGIGGVGEFDNGTFLGMEAGLTLAAGADNNIFIGYRSGKNITTGSNNIIIGVDTNGTSASITNQLNIGNTIYGNISTGNVAIGTSTVSATHKLQVVGSAGLSTSATWTNTSDERLKDIHGPYTKGLLEISQLQPVIFNYKKNNPQNLPSDVEITGFIAQQVQPIFPEAISTGADGYLNFNIHPINIAMINAVKELKLQNDSLKTENEKLKSEISAIKTYLCKQDPTSTLCEN
jgi:hypothetical protein